MSDEGTRAELRAARLGDNEGTTSVLVQRVLAQLKVLQSGSLPPAERALALTAAAATLTAAAEQWTAYTLEVMVSDDDD